VTAPDDDQGRVEALAEAAWRWLLNQHTLARHTSCADPAELHRIARQLATADTHRPIEAPHPERRA